MKNHKTNNPVPDSCENVPKVGTVGEKTGGAALYPPVRATETADDGLCRLLALPRELRDEIYKWTLVERPRWEKPHRPCCPYHPGRCGQVRQPPFMLARKHCSCAARKGVALLRLNRQIHEEAAPLFWGLNAHCFNNTRRFARDVGALRPRYRRLLRHVRILTNLPDDRSLYAGFARWRQLEWPESTHRPPPPADEQAWKMIIRCQGLQTLEVTPSMAMSFPQYLHECGTKLPRLQSFLLHHFNRCDVGESNLKVTDHKLGVCYQWKHLYYAYGRTVDLAALRDGDAERTVRDFVDFCDTQMERMLYISRVLPLWDCTRGCEPVRCSEWTYPLPLREDLEEVAYVHNFVLSEDTTVPVTLYCLPMSQRTLSRMQRAL